MTHTYREDLPVQRLQSRSRAPRPIPQNSSHHLRQRAEAVQCSKFVLRCPRSSVWQLADCPYSHACQVNMQACKPIPLQSYIVSSHSTATTRHAEQLYNQFTMIWEHAFIWTHQWNTKNVLSKIRLSQPPNQLSHTISPLELRTASFAAARRQQSRHQHAALTHAHYSRQCHSDCGPMALGSSHLGQAYSGTPHACTARES